MFPNSGNGRGTKYKISSSFVTCIKKYLLHGEGNLKVNLDNTLCWKDVECAIEATNYG